MFGVYHLIMLLISLHYYLLFERCWVSLPVQTQS